MNMTLRAYQPVIDEPACFALWHRALGDEWRIDEEVFHQLISLPGNEDCCAHFVVEMDQWVRRERERFATNVIFGRRVVRLEVAGNLCEVSARLQTGNDLRNRR